MTGQEFAAMLHDNGYTQKQFAEIMGVHRTTVAARCGAKQVEPHWVYALVGVLTARTSGQVAAIVKHAGLPMH